MQNKPANAYLLLTLTALFWSGNIVVGRYLSPFVPPFTLAFWRWTITFILVLPLALPHLRQQWPQLKAGWRPVLYLGLLSVGGYNTLVYIALKYTTATNAGMLNSFIPVATIGLSFILFGRRLSRGEIIGVVLSLLGVLSIVSQGRLTTLLGLKLNIGDIWMLASVLVWGLYTTGLQWRPQGVHPMLLLAAMTATGLLALTPLYGWELAHSVHTQFTPGAIAGILYIGIFPSFLGYVFYNAGVAAVGPNKGALFIHLMPVFGTLLAVLFLGERPMWYHYVGLPLILCGIVTATRSHSR